MMAVLPILSARVVSASTPAQAQPAAARSPQLSSVVAALLVAINKDRAKHHAAPLVLDPKQSACSRRHSLHMASLDALSHDQFPADVCIKHTWTAENVGTEDADQMTAAMGMHQAMMDEGPCPHRGCPNGEFEAHGHYVNLINPRYTHVGIGLAWTGTALWLTEDFTD